MATEFDSDYTRYQADRSALRKYVRRIYLKRAAAQVEGPTLDFGCGVGELLGYLPAGSRGLEYNKATVEYCRSNGLPVDFYDGFQDGWSLSLLDGNEGLRSMVISHVLEHLDEPLDVLRQLLEAARRLKIERILVIVPGRAGFKIDSTHRVFVDAAMLDRAQDQHWSIRRSFYFPFPFRRAGDVFVYNELHAVFQSTAR